MQDPALRPNSGYTAGVVILHLILLNFAGCTKDLSIPVEIDGPASLAVGWGEPASAQIATTGPAVVRITAVQRNVDVSLTAISADTKIEQTVDSPLGRNATEYLTLRTRGPDIITIELRSVDEEYAQGSVSLMYSALPERNGSDHALVAAELALTAVERTTGETSNWEARADEYQRIATTFENIDLVSRSADVLMRAAVANYSHLFRWKLSARLASEAHTYFDQNGATRNGALALALQGAALIEAMSEDASQLSEEKSSDGQIAAILRTALNNLLETGDVYNSARVTNDIGLLNYYLGDYDNSRENYERANNLFSSISETRWQAITLQNLLLQDFELRRDVANAPARYEQLLNLIDKEKDQDLYVDILNNAALANTLLGNLTAAIGQHEQALQLWQNHAERGRIYRGFALATIRGGDFERARTFLETAIPLLGAANDYRGLASAELLLGNIYRNAGKFDKAILHHQSSIVAYRSTYRKARSRIELAKDFLAAHDHAATIEQIDRLDGDGPLDSPDIDSGVYLLRAALAIATDDHARGRQLAQDGKSLADRFGLRDRLLDAQILIADSYEIEGDRQKMREALHEAVSLLDDIRSRIGSPQLRATLLAERGDPYDRLIASYFDEVADEPQTSNDVVDGLLELALQTIEHSRSRVFREQILAVNGDDSFTNTLFSAIAKHERLIYEHSSGRSSSSDLIESTEEISRIASSLLTASTAAPSTIQDQPSVSEIRERLNIGDVLLSYWSSHRASKLMVVRKDSLNFRTLPDIGDIERGVGDLIDYVSNPATKSTDAHRAVVRLRSQLLPEGVITDKDRRVYVQADGALHAVPFQLLVGNEKSVARVVSLNPVNGTNREHAGHSLVLANSSGANVEYSSGVVTLAPVSTQSSLPYVEVEVEALQLYLDQSQTDFRLENEATRASLFHPSSFAYDTIHIAAHAFANPIMPELSWIQLGDGKLFSGEIEKTELPARLVVLSACESGLGRNIGREGVFGLTRSFLIAGANGVVASLWQVSDRSTAELFRNFYRISHVDNRSVPESLLAAQNQVREMPRWQHPYYWSGFEVWLRSPFDAWH